jgi:hypothetical protein
LTSSSQNQYHLGEYHAEEDDKENCGQDVKAGSVFTDNGTRSVDGDTLCHLQKDKQEYEDDDYYYPGIHAAGSTEGSIEVFHR